VYNLGRESKKINTLLYTFNANLGSCWRSRLWLRRVCFFSVHFVFSRPASRRVCTHRRCHGIYISVL